MQPLLSFGGNAIIKISNMTSLSTSNVADDITAPEIENFLLDLDSGQLILQSCSSVKQ